MVTVKTMRQIADKPWSKDPDQRPISARGETAWLIQCGSRYFVADGDWCDNPNHAHRFRSMVDANTKADTMKTMEPVSVNEHEWVSDLP